MPDAILGTTFFGAGAPAAFGRFDASLITLVCVAAGMGWPQARTNPEGEGGDGGDRGRVGEG